MATTTATSQYLAQRQRMADDVKRLLEQAKGQITAADTAGAQASLDQAIARLNTISR